MSKKNAIITLVFMALLIGIFCSYLYYTNKLAIEINKESIRQKDEEKSLTQEEKRQLIIKALEDMRDNDQSDMNQEDKQKIIVDSLRQMQENESTELSHGEKKQQIIEALERMKANED
jgi:hypothetical protein